MVTDFDQLERFMDKLGRPAGKPILAGIFLLKSAKNALFINRNLPGCRFRRPSSSGWPRLPTPGRRDSHCRRTGAPGPQICNGVHLMAVKTEHLIPRILDEAGIPPLSN
jgi:methylenetetrahydrofolate reductase (NADPH)